MFNSSLFVRVSFSVTLDIPIMTTAVWRAVSDYVQEFSVVFRLGCGGQLLNISFMPLAVCLSR